MPGLDGLELTRAIRADPARVLAAGRHRHLAGLRRGPAPGDRGGRRRLHGEAELRPADPAGDRRAAGRPVTGAVMPARMLICEDSRAYAAALRRGCSSTTATSTSPRCAPPPRRRSRRCPRVRPDLVTMDIELPGMDGLAAVEEIMSSRPLPILVLSATSATAATGGRGAGRRRAGRARQGRSRPARSGRGRGGRVPAPGQGAQPGARSSGIPRARLRGRPPRPQRRRAGASVIGVCASTGGPQVLARCSGRCPPITRSRCSWCSTSPPGSPTAWSAGSTERAPLPVGSPRTGSRRAGRLDRAGGRAPHAGPAPGGCAWTGTRSRGRHRPSGDVLLDSIAAAAGRAGRRRSCSAGWAATARRGAAAVRRSGGLAIAQDEESSAVYGMPKAAVDLRGRHRALSRRDRGLPAGAAAPSRCAHGAT